MSLPAKVVLVAALLDLFGASAAAAQSPLRPEPRNHPPYAPAITEPESDGQIVNASDVHMETAPMEDPDAGDVHVESDFEIWLVAPAERVWIHAGASGVEKVHTHLGDGAFEGSHAGFDQLLFETHYRLRVRHRDRAGAWSPFAERAFETAPRTTVFPLELDDVIQPPVPAWRDETGTDVELPFGGTPGTLRVESPAGELLLALIGIAGPGNSILDPPELDEHVPVRVVISGGSSVFLAPISTLELTDHEGEDVTCYLPSLNLAAGEAAWLWIAANGASYWGSAQDTEPDFSSLAEGPPVPWAARQPGYRVDVFASGFQLPVNIAFVPDPGSDPAAPRFYVTELYGTIRVVTNGGQVGAYATGLLNFDPSGAFPGSGETGLSGISVDPASGDVFAALMYEPTPSTGQLYPKVVRFRSTDGGLTAASQTTILEMPGEAQGQSHFVSTVTIGPDGRLFVHMGDGFSASTALDLDSFRGKILRMELDGSPASDNPFYSAGDGIGARDYVFAYGFRNPFGGAWRGSELYEVENGPGSRDRLALVLAGVSYGWDGSAESLATHAIYNWTPPHAPVQIAFVAASVFGGSGFPPAKWGHAFVTESGPTYATGAQPRGKRIVEFEIDAGGGLVSGPAPLVEYTGAGKATAVGLAAGPDGLYFTDLYEESGAKGPTGPGASILRVRRVGTADFVADVTQGDAPLAVSFTDLSDVPGASAWSWSFGDGATSSMPNPVHTYTADGAYTVRLEVTGTSGVAVEQKNPYVFVGTTGSGLAGEYFDGSGFSGASLRRIDPAVDFAWGSGSPDPALGADTFSVRWSGRVEPESTAVHDFLTTTSDGVRLWVDGALIIDRWIDQTPTTHAGSIALDAGRKYELTMEYYEQLATATAILEWQSASLAREVVPQRALFPNGLAAEYFAGVALAGPPLLRRVDPGVDFDWASGSPAAGVPSDLFSARWTGSVTPRYSQTYTFTTTTDDGVRLWVDGTLLVDRWVDQSATQHSGSIALVAGVSYDVQMEYYERGGNALARLEWQSASQPREVVPPVRLRP